MSPSSKPGAGKAAVAVVERVGNSAAAEDLLRRLDADPSTGRRLAGPERDLARLGAEEVTAGALNQVAFFEPKKSWRIGGGNQPLPKALAAKLDGATSPNTPVTPVENRDDGGFTLTTVGGEEEFDAVIVAVSFAVIRDRSVIVIPTSDAREKSLAGVVQGHAVALQAPLNHVPETSAVMSLAGRYWTWTAVDEAPNWEANPSGSSNTY